MAALTITEYARAVSGVVEEPALATQILSITTRQITSEPFDTRTKIVRLHTDAACSVVFGSAPTVNAGFDSALPANLTEFRGVSPGLKLAVIAR